MSHFCQKLAPYQFLTAFPQLTSRICHADIDVFSQLKVCSFVDRTVTDSVILGDHRSSAGSIPATSDVDDHGSVKSKYVLFIWSCFYTPHFAVFVPYANEAMPRDLQPRQVPRSQPASLSSGCNQAD
jgi:hypothetical protein